MRRRSSIEAHPLDQTGSRHPTRALDVDADRSTRNRRDDGIVAVRNADEEAARLTRDERAPQRIGLNHNVGRRWAGDVDGQRSEKQPPNDKAMPLPVGMRRTRARLVGVRQRVGQRVGIVGATCPAIDVAPTDTTLPNTTTSCRTAGRMTTAARSVETCAAVVRLVHRAMSAI